MIPKPKRIKDPAAVNNARLLWCEYCGRTGAIHVHHLKTKGAGGHDIPENLMSLCKDCHAAVHNGQISKDKLLRVREGNNA